MTYGVIDVERREMTFARAGHCPLIHVPANQPAGMRKARMLVPDGLVVGLQIDDGTMFDKLLQEQTIALEPGDLIVWFTDGISETMNEAFDCFGEQRLAQVRRAVCAPAVRSAALVHPGRAARLRRRRRPARRYDDDPHEDRGADAAACPNGAQRSVSERRRRERLGPDGDLPHAVRHRSERRRGAARQPRRRDAAHRRDRRRAVPVLGQPARRDRDLGAQRRRAPRPCASSRAIASRSAAAWSCRCRRSSMRSRRGSATASAIAACSSTR